MVSGESGSKLHRPQRQGAGPLQIVPGHQHQRQIGRWHGRLGVEAHGTSQADLRLLLVLRGHVHRRQSDQEIGILRRERKPAPEQLARPVHVPSAQRDGAEPRHRAGRTPPVAPEPP